jgi:ectoine hydroxylase-related dioxygenase (phytanoyl-CoA dioxygenase family)
MINIKNFNYEFDLNGFVVLKNVIKSDKIKLANKILANIEKQKKSNLKGDIFFGKSPSNREAYISNVLSAGKVFEDFALIPDILVLLNHVTSNFFRLNHAVAMTKFKKNTFTPLHMGNIPLHPKIFYFVKDGKIFSNVTKVVFPLMNNTKEDGGFSVIKGSHKSNFRRPFDNNPKNNYLLEHVNANPGDAIFFTESLAHGSGVNKTNRIRRILSYCYSVKYMPDWTKFGLNFSKEYINSAPNKIKKLIYLEKS